MTTTAEVVVWGRRIGAVAWDERAAVARFQYVPQFAGSGIQIAPLTMPLRTEPYAFPALARETFHGLPGLLADALPDRYGTDLVDEWLARKGRLPGSLDPVERLCISGERGMGALEFHPAKGLRSTSSDPLDIAELVAVASAVLARRRGYAGSTAAAERERSLRRLLLVGTSAGGARAKAVIAWNRATGEVRSGQGAAPPGFEHWLLKFDGVGASGDHGLADPAGYGAVELAYARMAVEAGIAMEPCELLEEGGRRHFLTRRFDRTRDGRKLHLQSLGAMAHLDYNAAGAHSYEQALLVIRRLGLGMAAVEEQFRRMAFNVVARNQDDHVKNIAFLMEPDGRWRLSPAYDITYAFNPGSPWTGLHQMALAGKRDGFALDDLRAVAATASMKRGRAERILGEVLDAVQQWPRHAAAAGVAPERAERIGRAHRLAWS